MVRAKLGKGLDAFSLTPPNEMAETRFVGVQRGLTHVAFPVCQILLKRLSRAELN
jgi:hypothetical protein